VVTKLADRGSHQTLGIVTDVGLFVRQLTEALVNGSPPAGGATAATVATGGAGTAGIEEPPA
jgi:hypothetical protein